MKEEISVQHIKGHSEEHAHGIIDPSITTNERGIWALKWSLIGFILTSGIQFAIVLLSGSVALLTDAIHNFGDAGTAIPLWFAFQLSKRKPNQKFTYGLGRAEDLAGLFILLVILLTTIFAGYEAVSRLFHPQQLSHLWIVALAALVGFIGNETIAHIRIKVGKEIQSAALVADGQHARIDGLASLAVIIGVIGAWLGYPIVDPLVGIGIIFIVLHTLWEAGKEILTRLLDGIDDTVIQQIQGAVGHAKGIEKLTDIRARWCGHLLFVELTILVKQDLSVAKGHVVASDVRCELLDHMPYIADVIVHVEPTID